jgi:hypothetical protein
MQIDNQNSKHGFRLLGQLIANGRLPVFADSQMRVVELLGKGLF